MNAAKPKTRDRILASARELFFSKGLDETSIAEICKHSGVSNGSLFHHFPTKEAIYPMRLTGADITTNQ